MPERGAVIVVIHTVTPTCSCTAVDETPPHPASPSSAHPAAHTPQDDLRHIIKPALLNPLLHMSWKVTTQPVPLNHTAWTDETVTIEIKEATTTIQSPKIPTPTARSPSVKRQVSLGARSRPLYCWCRNLCSNNGRIVAVLLCLTITVGVFIAVWWFAGRSM